MRNVPGFIFMILLIPVPVFANENITRMVHGVHMDLCTRVEGCVQSVIEHCRGEMRNAFKACDNYLQDEKPNVPLFETCVGDEMNRRLGKNNMMQMMHYPACKAETDPGAVSRAQMPRAVERPRYFTPIGLDMNSLYLAESAIEACQRGATRQIELAQKNNANIRIDINLAQPVKTQSITGDGESGYNHLLQKPTYEYGKCTGKHITNFIRDDNGLGYKRGQKIVADYEPVLYVVIDCTSIPRPSICD